MPAQSDGAPSDEVAELRALVAAQQETIAALTARVVELERLLEESHRSGKRQAAPFSKGEPNPDPRRPGRRSGEEHGRHGHRLVPARVDREIDAPVPELCPDCGGDLVLERVATQYQTELPEVAPVTTAFRIPICRCSSCGRRVQGRHSEQTSDALGAAAAQVGPRAKSFATWLHYSLGLSFGRTSEVLSRFGITVTPGALSSSAQATGTALVPTDAAIRAALAASPQVTMDETGWRICGNGAWLWVATTEGTTAYVVAPGRSLSDAQLLVSTDYSGVIIRDGYVIYRNYDKATHQSCLAHLLRRCDEMLAELPEWARHTPRRVRELLLDALACRELEEMDRLAARDDIAELIDLLLEEPQVHDACRRLVAHLRNEQEALLTFLTHGTDATNWRAEQGVRPAVVNRKVSGGNRSERGAATQGRIMSLLRTAHQRGLDGVELLVELARAPAPIVLPLGL